MKQQIWRILKFFTSKSSYGNLGYMALPCGFLLENHVLRIIYSDRNSENKSVPYYLDLDLKTLEINITNPVKIEASTLGAFDDSGVMPSSFINLGNGKIWMYYIGWNLGVTVPFRNSLGLAISEDNGLSFKRMFAGPILDRTNKEPHFNASACVMYDEQNVWKVWYLSCVGWDLLDNQVTHKYHIKYAESIDGIVWKRDGIVAIDFKYDNEYAISVPRVIKDGDLFKMWYSYRGGPFSEFYRIGYAESKDGINWIRYDEFINLNPVKEGLDDLMQCYPFIFDYENKRYMLYNGNGYGKTGFGIAVLE